MKVTAVDQSQKHYGKNCFTVFYDRGFTSIINSEQCLQRIFSENTLKQNNIIMISYFVNSI